MATLVTNTQLTLIELAKRLDPKGNAAVIAEVLDETNEIMSDIPFALILLVLTILEKSGRIWIRSEKPQNIYCILGG